MKVNIPAIKRIPKLPTFGEQLEAMTDAELESIASDCTERETAALGRLTDEQLRAVVHVTAEGLRLMAQL